IAEKNKFSDVNGVLVDSIFPGSAAEDAGLKVGDVITKVNQVTVNTTPELQEQISRYHPGDKVEVVYTRDGKERSVNVTLKNIEGNTDITKKEVSNDQLSALGADFQDLTAKEKKDLGLDGGVKVAKIYDGKISRSTNLHEGFIITKVDNHPVNSVS